MKDIATVFRAIEGLRERIGRQPLRQGQLEQLAQGNELAHAIVRYRRLQKHMRQLDAICRGEKNGKGVSVIQPGESRSWKHFMRRPKPL